MEHLYYEEINTAYKKEELNPCKCGSTGKLHRYRNRLGYYRIYCDKCANQFYFDSKCKIEVLLNWNNKNPEKKRPTNEL